MESDPVAERDRDQGRACQGDSDGFPEPTGVAGGSPSAAVDLDLEHPPQPSSEPVWPGDSQHAASAHESVLLDQLLRTIPDNIYFKDRKSRFLKINDALARWLGLSDPGDAVGKTDADFFGAEHAHKAYADEQRVMGTGIPLVAAEEKETWPDGRTTWVSTSKVPIRDGAGRTVGVCGISRDITERKIEEERARLSQKMEAIGRLAGGVAHDFNNLLGVMIGYTEKLLHRLATDSPLRADATEILKGAQRAADLTHQLLAFSRKQVLRPQVLDLNSVVHDVHEMLARVIGEDCDLETLLEPGLGAIWADEGQTGQIILNLAANARDAMPRGGRLTIETRNVELDAKYSLCHPSMLPGRYVMLAVSDTGLGMDAETRTHIFEPFFTTKEPGKGTGLGLATVYGIVKQSGGFIWVYSEPGVGSTFKVHLPRIDGTPTPAERPDPRPQARGTETILLVEDEPSLRNIVRETLEENGYRVLPAADGAQALQVVDEYRDPVHLVVADVIMPGISGPQVVERIATIRPHIKALYVSGYTQEAINRHGELGPGTAFLSKPFTAAVLLAKCRTLLDDEGAGRPPDSGRSGRQAAGTGR